MMHLDTDVLVIGAGGAGMYAAIEAARSGACALQRREFHAPGAGVPRTGIEDRFTKHSALSAVLV